MGPACVLGSITDAKPEERANMCHILTRMIDVKRERKEHL